MQTFLPTNYVDYHITLISEIYPSEGIQSWKISGKYAIEANIVLFQKA